jgi:hypothetical protein
MDAVANQWTSDHWKKYENGNSDGDARKRK